MCFVCLGNICRSPMAASVFRAAVAGAGLADRVEVSSGGTADWHTGKPADPRTVRVLARAGYPTDHVARQVTAADLLRLDLVVAMDRSNLADLSRLAPAGSDPELRLLRSFDPGAGDQVDGLDVPDPYHDDAPEYEATLAMVEGALPGLLAHVRAALDR